MLCKYNKMVFAHHLNDIAAAEADSARGAKSDDHDNGNDDEG